MVRKQSAVSYALTATMIVGICSGAFAAGHSHVNHPAGKCHELKLSGTIIYDQDAYKTADPNVRGPLVMLKLRLSNRAMSDNHGVKVFVDGRMIYNNDALSGDALSVPLDLSSLSVGDHYIIVNVCDHNDHIGITSWAVEITVNANGKGKFHIKNKNEPVNAPAFGAPASGVDFVGASPFLGCCGRGSDWANGNCGNTRVSVTAG